MLKCIAALIGLFISISAMAAELAIKLPGRDDLVLDLPNEWAAQVNRSNADLPPTITVVPKAGAAFQVLITALWPMNGMSSPTLGGIRSLVERGVREVQPQAVEQSLSLKEMAGVVAKGYYFSATDRQPEPNGYKYMTQGAVMLNELSITFTILVNGETSGPTEKALQMLRGAHRASARPAS